MLGCSEVLRHVAHAQDPAFRMRGIIGAPGDVAQYVCAECEFVLPRATRDQARIVVSSFGSSSSTLAAIARPEAFVEVHVRSARLTDLDAAVRLLSRDEADPGAERTDADYLRNLLFVPSATILVADAERRVVGVGVLSIRPSVRSGPFVGIVDDLGLARADLDAADRRGIADAIVEHLATSARNKGCTRVEVSEPLASAEPSLWKRLGFASRGRTLGRPLGRPIG
jgi:predicted N-acetyltransferase YhbS